MAPWPSGKAKVCNTSLPGSIPGGTSSKKAQSFWTGLSCWSRHSFIEPGFLAPRGRKKSGSYTPPEDRRAACAARHSPGAERANSRQRRDSGTQGASKKSIAIAMDFFICVRRTQHHLRACTQHHLSFSSTSLSACGHK